jgi:hypothetical protein
MAFYVSKFSLRLVLHNMKVIRKEIVMILKIDMWDVHAIALLINEVSPLVKLSGNEELTSAMADIEEMLQQDQFREVLETMRQIRSFSDEDLLNNWLSYYDLMKVKFLDGEDICEYAMLRRELQCRGLEDRMEELTSGKPAVIELMDPDEERIFKEQIGAASNEELLQLWTAYYDMVMRRKKPITKDVHKHYLLRRELEEKRGLLLHQYKRTLSEEDPCPASRYDA